MSSNRTKLQTTRKKIKNLHSRDRRSLYVSPSKRDVLCPNFDHQWVQIAATGYGNDMAGICHNPDADCDYKEELVEGVIHLCRRYWKNNDQNFQQISEGLPQLDGNRQSIRLNYDLIRLFLEKSAFVHMQVSKQVLSYQYLLYSSHNRLELWSEDGSESPWEFNTDSTRCYENVNAKTGVLLKGMDDENTYSYRFHFTPSSYDDDTIGTIFRYNRTTKNYYSMEWNRGGLSPTGLSIKKNIYNKDTGAYTSEVIYNLPNVYWRPDYSHVVYVDVYENQVNIRIQHYVYYPSHGHYHWEHTSHSVKLDDPRLSKGTYGIMTQSQTANITYFVGHTYVESSISTYIKQIDLSNLGIEGDNHILSDSMDVLFKDDRDAFLSANNMVRSDLIRETYRVVSSNVAEQVEFNDLTLYTTDPERKLSLRTWDYDIPIPYVKVIDIVDHVPQIVTDSYPIVNDVYVRSVQVEFTKLQLEDSFTLEVGGTLIYDKVPMLKNWGTQFDPYKHATTTFNIVFAYKSNQNPIYYFWKNEHIDTHDKVFTIKDGVLTWHHVPSIVE